MATDLALVGEDCPNELRLVRKVGGRGPFLVLGLANLPAVVNELAVDVLLPEKAVPPQGAAVGSSEGVSACPLWQERGGEVGTGGGGSNAEVFTRRSALCRARPKRCQSRRTERTEGRTSPACPGGRCSHSAQPCAAFCPRPVEGGRAARWSARSVGEGGRRGRSARVLTPTPALTLTLTFRSACDRGTSMCT